MKSDDVKTWAWWEFKLTIWHFLVKLNNHIFLYSAVSALGICPRETLAHVYQDTRL
jgi:hypothetical protein